MNMELAQAAAAAPDGRIPPEAVEAAAAGAFAAIGDGYMADVQEDTGMKLMIESEAKGTPMNALQIGTAFGQPIVGGKRPFLDMDGSRGLPQFALKSAWQGPAQGCFAPRGFREGLTPTQVLGAAAVGREGLATQGCQTSKSGYLGRRLVTFLSDNQVLSRTRMVQTSGKGAIFQICFSGGFVPRKCEYQTLRIVFCREELSRRCSDAPPGEAEALEWYRREAMSRLTPEVMRAFFTLESFNYHESVRIRSTAIRSDPWAPSLNRKGGAFSTAAIVQNSIATFSSLVRKTTFTPRGSVP